MSKYFNNPLLWCSTCNVLIVHHLALPRLQMCARNLSQVTLVTHAHVVSLPLLLLKYAPVSQYLNNITSLSLVSLLFSVTVTSEWRRIDFQSYSVAWEPVLSDCKSEQNSCQQVAWLLVSKEKRLFSFSVIVSTAAKQNSLGNSSGRWAIVGCLHFSQWKGP